MIIHIYSDGSLIPYGSKKIGTFGYYDPINRFIYVSDVYENTTSQVMEVNGFYSALRYSFRNNLQSIIHTDSNYTNLSYNTWMHSWFRIEFDQMLISSSASKLAHQLLWKKIWILSKIIKKAKLEIKVKWIKAHSTNKFNNLIDHLIRQKLRNYRQ